MTHHKRYVRTAAIVTGTLLLSGGLVQADQIEWRMATPWSGGPWLERDAQGFIERANQLTDGRVKITAYPSGTLGSALRVTDTVSSGAAQIGHNYIGYDYGRDPTTALLAGHSAGMTPEEYMLWMFNGGAAELYEEYRREEFDVVAFPCAILGTEIFLHSNKKVKTLEDFQNLRLRTSGSWAEVASRLGANTVVMPGGEVYSALERGIIDAAEWGSPEINHPTGLQDVAQYVIVPGIHQSGGVLECEVNQRAWDALSEHDQDMLRLAGKLTVFESWLNSSFADLEAYQELLDGPNEIVQLSDEFLAAVAEETAKWENEKAADNEWFNRILDSQRQFKNSMSVWPEYRLSIGETLGVNR